MRGEATYGCNRSKKRNRYVVLDMLAPPRLFSHSCHNAIDKIPLSIIHVSVHSDTWALIQTNNKNNNTDATSWADPDDITCSILGENK